MARFGEKSDSSSWERAMVGLHGITDIYEDKEKNLEAAGIAARKLGHNPKLYTQIPQTKPI